MRADMEDKRARLVILRVGLACALAVLALGVASDVPMTRRYQPTSPARLMIWCITTSPRQG